MSTESAESGEGQPKQTEHGEQSVSTAAEESSVVVDTLKPCPWCGETPSQVVRGNYTNDNFVICNNRKCWLSQIDRLIPVEWWNKRARLP